MSNSGPGSLVSSILLLVFILAAAAATATVTLTAVSSPHALFILKIFPFLSTYLLSRQAGKIEGGKNYSKVCGRHGAICQRQKRRVLFCCCCCCCSCPFGFSSFCFINWEPEKKFGWPKKSNFDFNSQPVSQPANQPTSTLLIQGGIDQFNIILNLQSNHQRECCRAETKARKSSKAIKADSNQNIKKGKRENKFRQNFGSFTDKQLCCFSPLNSSQQIKYCQELNYCFMQKAGLFEYGTQTELLLSSKECAFKHADITFC